MASPNWNIDRCHPEDGIVSALGRSLRFWCFSAVFAVLIWKIPPRQFWFYYSRVVVPTARSLGVWGLRPEGFRVGRRGR
jgi:hypothetical protein